MSFIRQRFVETEAEERICEAVVRATSHAAVKVTIGIFGDQFEQSDWSQVAIRVDVLLPQRVRRGTDSQDTINQLDLCHAPQLASFMNLQELKYVSIIAT
jgi:hypothetical protein